MIKYKNILWLVSALIFLTSIIVNEYSRDTAYQLNIENTLPIIENKRVFSISEYIDEVNKIEKKSPEVDIDLNNEEIETKDNEVIHVENSFDLANEENLVDESNDKVENHNIDKDTENNLVLPNRGTSITNNRTVSSDLSQHLNNYVLDVIKTYNLEEGSYPYLLNNDYENYNGVTEDIYYKGELILKAHPSKRKYSHCTGITFEVFFKAMQSRNQANGIDVNDFNLTWYVAKGPKSESNLAVAIEKYGLGNRITNLEEVAPGDFIDLSRENNTGHAVIFIDWIREGNRIIGLKHWSSQQSTEGISYKKEYFNVRDSNGKKYGNVIFDSLNIARISPINEYK